MRRLVLKMSMTLDGYVGGPTGEIDWIMRTPRSRRHRVDRASPLASPRAPRRPAHIRRHDRILAVRNATDAQHQAGLDTTLPAAGWDDTRVLGADLAADISSLKAEPGKDLVAHGGASFAQALVRHG